MSESNKVTLGINCQVDVSDAQRKVKDYALELGFDQLTVEEISIVVGELGTNIIVHAVSGSITFSEMKEEEKSGIKIQANDFGPGIADVDQAIGDGFSTKGSLGYGLGTVNRLMDDLQIKSQRGPDSYTHIIALRWKRALVVSANNCPLDIGVASRPHPRMETNGDAFVIRKWENFVLLAVIDGLGHGQYAHRASNTARLYIETHYDQPMANIFKGVGYACRATRGAVMAIAKIDWVKEKLTFASLGNIEVKIHTDVNPIKVGIKRGILGISKTQTTINEVNWDNNNIMFMYSDGIKAHWEIKDFEKILGFSSTQLAGEILRKYSREDDDATIAIIKARQR